MMPTPGGAQSAVDVSGSATTVAGSPAPTATPARDTGIGGAAQWQVTPSGPAAGPSTSSSSPSSSSSPAQLLASIPATASVTDGAANDGSGSPGLPSYNDVLRYVMADRADLLPGVLVIEERVSALASDPNALEPTGQAPPKPWERARLASSRALVSPTADGAGSMIVSLVPVADEADALLSSSGLGNGTGSGGSVLSPSSSSSAQGQARAAPRASLGYSGMPNYVSPATPAPPAFPVGRYDTA